MGTAESIRQVAGILVGHMGGGHMGLRPIAVVSATSGTTDQLIGLGEKAVTGDEWHGVLEGLVARHAGIIDELGMELDLSHFWEDIERLVAGTSMIGELSLSARDRLIGFGERISSEILAAYLNSMDIHGVMAEALDAYNLIFCDNNFSEGNVDFAKSYAAISERLGGLLANGVIPVITGFVAQAENGHYITLGRGGSDYSGAIVAAALDASELQIWTDVDGILSTDPRLVPEAKVLEQLSFNEAGELAYFGAKVLHPKTIKPAIEKNIPVRILNTFNVDAVGTLITNEATESLKSVTYKKNISIINICSAGMLLAHGFLARIFEVFEKHGISVDVVSTSEVSVSLTVDGNAGEELLNELGKFATITVQEGMAIVCLVGEGIRSNTRVLGDLFSAIAEHDVSMVSQGASKRNITFLVKAEEAPEVVKKTFNTFFK